MHKTGLENYYITRGNKKMQYGFTTGTCAAAAAKGAGLFLVSGNKAATVDIGTPKGIELNLEITLEKIDDGVVECTVIKNSGDDPDVSDGMPVVVRVSYTEDHGVSIDGGVGVGRVTQSGLQQKIGEAAINRVPRQMIENELNKIRDNFHVEKGLHAEIILPWGRELSSKTFNPRLGIEGGLSILGTSGIIEPMSESAIIESIRIELVQKRKQGLDKIIIAPGNYGSDFIKSEINLEDNRVVKCSNYLGVTIDMLKELEYKEVLFISHIGKFVKVAGGIMNTHSREADGRMEILAACAAKAGLDSQGIVRVLDATTTDDGLAVISEAGLLELSMKIMGEKINFNLNNRSYSGFKTGAIVFSNKYGILCKCGEAEELMKEYKRK